MFAILDSERESLLLKGVIHVIFTFKHERELCDITIRVKSEQESLLFKGVRGYFYF